MGGIDYEVCCSGDERGNWFRLIGLVEGSFEELSHGFHSELIGIQFPRVVEVGVVFDEIFGFFVCVFGDGIGMGFEVEVKHFGHVLVVVSQFMK